MDPALLGWLTQFGIISAAIVAAGVLLARSGHRVAGLEAMFTGPSPRSGSGWQA